MGTGNPKEKPLSYPHPLPVFKYRQQPNAVVKPFTTDSISIHYAEFAQISGVLRGNLLDVAIIPSPTERNGNDGWEARFQTETKALYFTLHGHTLTDNT